jgi:hypothetical protein
MCIQVPLQKAADSEDCGHDRRENAPTRYTNEVGCAVCNALYRRSQDIDNTHYNQQLFVKGVSLTDHVSNDGSIVYNLSECSLRTIQCVTVL